MKQQYRRQSDSQSLSKDENGNYIAPFELRNRADTLNKRAEFKQDVIFSISTVLTMGILFGFFMNKARVFETGVIRDQFKFERFIMLKMFCSAAGTSCFALTVGHFVCSECWECTRVKNRGATNLWGILIGSMMLGAGMALCGGCPGMVWIQIGSGVHNSLISVAGCFAGALIYGFIHPIIEKLFLKEHIGEFFDEVLNISYPKLAIACGVLFFIVAGVLEYAFPWKTELTDEQRENLKHCDFFNCEAWNPIACGVGVGALQLPCIFILGNTLGSSSAYTALCGQWLRCVSDDIKLKFCHFKAQLNRWWQVTYIMSAAIGSYFACVAVVGWDNWSMNNFSGVNEIDAFVGGFVMLFGARLAKGCTSGHGLSGTALMTIGSFLGVGGMFLGGYLLLLVYTNWHWITHNI